MPLLRIRQALAAFLDRTPDASAAMAASGSIAVGEAACPIGYAFLSDMEVSSEHELRQLGADIPAALRSIGIEEDGPLAGAILAVRTPGGARVFLYRASMDGSGEHPHHDFTVVRGGKAKIVRLGSVVVRCAEVDPDGAMGAESIASDGEPPGDNPDVPELPGLALDDAAGMAIGNVVRSLALDLPDEATAIAWSARHFGAIALPGGAEAPPRFPKAPPAPKKAKPRVDLAKLADRLKGSVRTAFIPGLRPAQGDEPACGGRTAFIPSGSSWPEGYDEPMAPVMQLRVADMPEPARSHLGGSGLFQLFLPTMFRGMDVPFVARVVDPSAPGEWVPTPAGALPDGTQPLAVDGWRETGETPSINDLFEGPSAIVGKRPTESQTEVIELVGPETIDARKPADEVARIAAEEGFDPAALEEVAGLLSHDGGDKLLGWPTWLQAPEWPTGRSGKGMVPLLQVALGRDAGIGAYIGDRAGTAQLFVSTDGERRFRLTWA